MRIETGVVQFGDDWPGVFIRGDNAAGMWIMLHNLANDDSVIPQIQRPYVRKLMRLLEASNVNSENCKPQKLKSAQDCIAQVPHD